jgi:hypothetical protein
MVYMVFAYGIIIVAIVGYTMRLWLNERSCRRQIEALLESESRR